MLTQSNEHIVLSRLYRFPAQRVFEAWINPQQISKWWAPDGATVPFCMIDLRTGGRFTMYIRSENGLTHRYFALFAQIVKEERLVLHFYDQPGSFLKRPAVLLMVDFDQHSNGTRVVVSAEKTDRGQHPPIAAFQKDPIEQRLIKLDHYLVNDSKS